MNAREWLEAYAERLGTQAPTNDEFKLILDIAGEAAHGSERVAAPAACWVAANADVSLEEALAVAKGLGTDA